MYKKVNYEIDDNIKSIDYATKTLIIDIGSLSSPPLDYEDVNTNILITFFGIIYSEHDINRIFLHILPQKGTSQMNFMGSWLI